ncbi:MAG: T9SS type A sorting domain-containing protein, partial [Bacteroidota bacterium]
DLTRNVKDQLFIYANPTSGRCNITIPEEFIHEKTLNLTIYNSLGIKIQSIDLPAVEEEIQLNLSSHPAGIYHVVLNNGEKAYSGRIVIDSH